MKILLAAAAIALASSSGMSHSQQQSAPATGTEATSAGLSDLDAMTMSCSKAGLNAAAREAAKVPSQGTYQFAYFNIINSSHHATYEVRFKSNYTAEPDLRYCVTVYCQQGWDPNTKASVTLMTSGAPRKGGAPHVHACGPQRTPANRR